MIIQYANGSLELPDGSGCFIMEIDDHAERPPRDPVRWNPYNKVVQDHRTGNIDLAGTNHERWVRRLPIPWQPAYAEDDVRSAPMR